MTEVDLGAFDAFTGIRATHRPATVVDAVTKSTSREGEMTNAGQALATAAIVDLAQGTNHAGIIATQNRGEDTHSLVVLRHLADPFMQPIINDLMLVNSDAGRQFKRLFKIAMRGTNPTGGGLGSALKRMLRPGSE